MTFNKIDYGNKWKKENTKLVGASYKTDFVLEFKEACKHLGLSQSQLIREMMQATIDKARKEKQK